MYISTAALNQFGSPDSVNEYDELIIQNLYRGRISRESCNRIKSDRKKMIHHNLMMVSLVRLQSLHRQYIHYSGSGKQVSALHDPINGLVVHADWFIIHR